MTSKPTQANAPAPVIDLESVPASTLLSDAQTAGILGVTPATLSVWRSVGRYNLKFIKIGRNVRYRAGDVRDWLTTRERLHTGN